MIWYWCSGGQFATWRGHCCAQCHTGDRRTVSSRAKLGYHDSILNHFKKLVVAYRSIIQTKNLVCGDRYKFPIVKNCVEKSMKNRCQ